MWGQRVFYPRFIQKRRPNFLGPDGRAPGPEIQAQPALEATWAGLLCRSIGRIASDGRVEVSAKQRPQLNEFSLADPGATVTFSLPQEN
ncbi:MAG: hypothetical protein JRC92_03915 [Deltaproteobacteria bacterium]|nr:hypothetical protein [Deltaproteobacteria bacterium]